MIPLKVPFSYFAYYNETLPKEREKGFLTGLGKLLDHIVFMSYRLELYAIGRQCMLSS